MTVHQLLSERIARSSLAAVAAQIGVSEQDLNGFPLGIVLSAAPAARLAAWYQATAPAVD